MAYCANCGREVSPAAATCPECGHPHHGGTRPNRKTEGTAIASLVLGIAGFVICPVIPSILAVIFGKQAQDRIRRDPALEGEGMAKAGIVLGWIGIGLVGLAALVAVLVALAAAGGSSF